MYHCRRHPSPTKEMLEPLLRTAGAVGLSLDVSSSKALADSLDHAVVSPVCISHVHCVKLMPLRFPGHLALCV